MTSKLLLPLSACCVLLAACEPETPRPESHGTDQPPTAPTSATGDVAETSARSRPTTESADQILVVFLGDSLTAGYGLEEEQAHPALIEAELATVGWPVRVVNAGVSGDTTAGGTSRLDWLLRQQPDILVLSLGANDGMRGLPLTTSKEHLRHIVARARELEIRVLLTGMRMPPNYGDYADGFGKLFPAVAQEFEIPLVPYLLEGVADRPELNLADGIHPNVEGQKILAETILPYLLPLVEEVASEDGITLQTS